MGREGRLKQLSRDHVGYRVGLKSGGRLGFGPEPRETVTTTILDVFHARTTARLLELAGEQDSKLSPQPPTATSLEARLAAADQDLPEYERIKPFKAEVVAELARARIPGHTYIDAIASMCGEVITELYATGFDDRRTETIAGF